MWTESSGVPFDGHGNGRADGDARRGSEERSVDGVVTTRHRAGVFGERFYLWTSILALGAICRARRDDACMRTAAKLALAVSATYAVARTTRRFWGRAAEHETFASRAAAWAAAGVIQQDQGRGTALAAYSAAALSGARRRVDRRGMTDLVAGALLGRVMSRLVARL